MHVTQAQSQTFGKGVTKVMSSSNKDFGQAPQGELRQLTHTYTL